jgi:restriction endonuclease Mrr
MTAYRRRRWKGRHSYDPAAVKKYWDEKTLQNPDVLPKNFSYHVPEVKTPEPIPEPTEESVGLSKEMIIIARHFRDRFSPKPKFFELGFNLTSPFKAAESRGDFAKLADNKHRSRLFMGKTLLEVETGMKKLELKFQAHRAELQAQKELHLSQCEDRDAEILRRHRQRVERLKTVKEMERLHKVSKEEASKFEDENFPTLALNPTFWSDVSSGNKGTAFEKKFCRLLRDAGYTVKTTPLSGDDGIDIIAEKSGERVVIQCKNHTNKIGAAEVREFIGALVMQQVQHPATKGWIVSVSGFSKPTINKHRKNDLIELWDVADIEKFVRKTYNVSGM